MTKPSALSNMSFYLTLPSTSQSYPPGCVPKISLLPYMMGFSNISTPLGNGFQEKRFTLYTARPRSPSEINFKTPNLHKIQVIHNLKFLKSLSVSWHIEIRLSKGYKDPNAKTLTTQSCLKFKLLFSMKRAHKQCIFQVPTVIFLL